MMDNVHELIQELRGNALDVDYDEPIAKLVAMGDSIADDLIEVLRTPQDNDPNEHMRARVALVLGKIGDARAFETLVEATESQEEFLREKSIYALGQLGDKRAIGLLIAHLRNHWDRDTREEAAWALVNFPEPWVVHFLIRAFTDPDEIVRDAAVYSLMKIGLLAS